MTAGELFDRGLAMEKAGRYIRAEQYLFLAAAGGYPEEKTLPVLLQVCLAASRLRAALNHAEPYLARHPDHSSLRFLVASIHIALGQPQSARRQLLKIVTRHPAHAPAHYLLGVVMRDALNDPGSARESFTAYLMIEPQGEHADEAHAYLREQEAPP
jgi:predicted Zn-dependent protease